MNLGMEPRPAVSAVSRIEPFRAAYAPSDEEAVRRLLGKVDFDTAADARIDDLATDYIQSIRKAIGGLGGVDGGASGEQRLDHRQVVVRRREEERRPAMSR